MICCTWSNSSPNRYHVNLVTLLCDALAGLDSSVCPSLMHTSSLRHRRLAFCITRCRPFSSSKRLSLPTQQKEEGKEQADGGRSAPKDPTWSLWKKTVSKQFEKPHRPCNWLGGKVVEFFPVCVL